MAQIHRKPTGKKCCKWAQEGALFPDGKTRRNQSTATKRKNFEVNKMIKFP